MSLEKPCTCDDSLILMIEVMMVYDGALFFECRGCGQAWHRWPPDDRLGRLAAPYVDARNQAAQERASASTPAAGSRSDG